MSDSHIHVYGSSDQRVINRLRKFQELVMATLAELKEEVRQTKEVAAAGATAIRGLAAKIEELKNNPEELQKLADDLNAAQEDSAPRLPKCRRNLRRRTLRASDVALAAKRR